MVKPRNMEIVKDETAGEVKIHKLEYDKENEAVKEVEDMLHARLEPLGAKIEKNPVYSDEDEDDEDEFADERDSSRDSDDDDEDEDD